MINENNPGSNRIKLFLVDDDALFLKSLEIEFKQHADFTIDTFATGELCLQHLENNPDVIILDYHLDSIDKNKAEVAIDVNIYEVTHDTMLQLGNQIATSPGAVSLPRPAPRVA